MVVSFFVFLSLHTGLIFYILEKTAVLYVHYTSHYNIFFCALFFRHVRIFAISDNYLRYVRPSVHPYVSALLPLDGFSWNFILTDFIKMCPKSSDLVEIGHFARRPKYILLFPATLNNHTCALLDWIVIRILVRLSTYPSAQIHHCDPHCTDFVDVWYWDFC